MNKSTTPRRRGERVEKAYQILAHFIAINTGANKDWTLDERKALNYLVRLARKKARVTCKENPAIIKRSEYVRGFNNDDLWK